MYGYIYKTTNLINNKIYVGQKKSKVFVKDYFGSGTYILRALNKYGRVNFKVELIQWCSTKDDLNIKEKYWIKKLKSQYMFGNGYNITNGGEFGDTFSHLSLEEKEEKRNKHKSNNILPKWTEERKVKMSKRMSGKGNHMYGVSSPMKGKELTNDHKEKIRISNTGKKHNIDTIEKIKKNSKQRFEQMTEKEKDDAMKPLKKWIEENGSTQNKKVYVYENDILLYEFKTKNKCCEFFKDFGIGKKSIERNLLSGKSVFPDSMKGFRPEYYENLRQYKDYVFTYDKR